VGIIADVSFVHCREQENNLLHVNDLPTGDFRSYPLLLTLVYSCSLLCTHNVRQTEGAYLWLFSLLMVADAADTCTAARRPDGRIRIRKPSGGNTRENLCHTTKISRRVYNLAT
jgi:hypothetical protein